MGLHPKALWEISKNSSLGSQRVKFYYCRLSLRPLTFTQAGEKLLGLCSPKSRRKSKNLTKAGKGFFLFFLSPLFTSCPRSTGQSTGSSTQPTWRTYNNASRSQDQAQPVAVTQPSYFDPNSHSSFSSTVSSPPVASVSPPAPTPAVKGYDLSPTPSISK